MSFDPSDYDPEYYEQEHHDRQVKRKKLLTAARAIVTLTNKVRNVVNGLAALGKDVRALEGRIAQLEKEKTSGHSLQKSIQ
jgi:type II secretory pathway component PulF